MAGLLDYDYDFFDDYQLDYLGPLSSIEQLVVLDDEVANKVVIPRYEGPVDPVEWGFLEEYYSGLFADFINERIQGVVDTAPIEVHRDRFHDFRANIISLNERLPAQRAARTGVISRPAEMVLLKRLRELGFDSSALEVSYIGRGGGLYLLELFVTAAQQDALNEEPLLTTLLEETAALGEMGKPRAMARLHRPILMVTLWDNQAEGLERWLANDRHGILEMATATGKTVAGIAAIAECCGVLPEDPDHEPRTDDARILVVAHSNAILKQWEQEIQEKLGLLRPAGQASTRAQQVSFSGGTVDFYTAQSLLPQYDRNLAACYDLVIYDEVHHYSNKDGYGAAIARPNYDAAMGLSATVDDGGGLKRAQLTDLLGDVVHTYGVEDARRDGIIPDFDWTVHPTPLDPYEKEEWEEATDSISEQFKYIKRSRTTRQILRQLPVPFNHLEDLGDFIRAHEAAAMTLDDDQIPDDWSNLQATIHSRTWIRHRSQPKIDEAVKLARKYLEDPEQPVKLVMFAMDIDTANEIAERLGDVTDNVYRAHSKLERSSDKNRQTVQKNINSFASCDNGVLVSPKMLDEGIDVPDAEVGINVAGTKTKLQLVQRMGRVLRKHGDQRPHFHHFIAVPDDNYIAGLDSKEYVQELYWIRELGETIGVQPVIEEAGVDSELLERAEQRGHELWARDLLEDLEVETVQGNVHLDQLLEALTAEAVEILLDELHLNRSRLDKAHWNGAMESLRDSEALPIDGLQRVWWLFPLYRERPTDLEELLRAAHEAIRQTEDQTSDETASGDEPSDVLSDRVSTAIREAHDRLSTKQEESDSPTTLLSEEETPDTPGSADDQTAATAGSGEGVGDGQTSPDSDDGLVQGHFPDSLFEDLDVSPPILTPTARSDVEYETTVDEDLLTRVGSGGWLSTGYLCERSLGSYLLAGERPLFVLSSDDDTPSYSATSLSLNDGYRAITAVTPRRVLCVVGGRPSNTTIQIRHEDITRVDAEQTGHLLWKRSTLKIETGECTLTIPVTNGVDVEMVASYLRAAVYDCRCDAGRRLLECCDLFGEEGESPYVETALEGAEERFEAADEWGKKNDLNTSVAAEGCSFAAHCRDTIESRSSSQAHLEDARTATNEGRVASINGETARAEQLYLEAKSKLEAVESATTILPDVVEEAAQLLEKVDEALDSLDDATAEERASKSDSEPSSRSQTLLGKGSEDRSEPSIDRPESELDEQSVKTDVSSSLEEPSEVVDKQVEIEPKRAKLLADLQSLAESIGGVPKAPEMDEQGPHSTHDYYQVFGKWTDALNAAGLDRREEMLTELERVASELGEVPSTTQITEHSRYSAGMYSTEFGMFSNARKAAELSAIDDDSSDTPKKADVDDEPSKEDEGDVPTQPSREQLVAEVQRLDDASKLVPYTSQMSRRGKYSAHDCLREFGSWDEALEAAGIDKRSRLIDELHRVRDEIGSTPRTTDMNHVGRVSAGMYSDFFGSWGAATAHLDDPQTSSNSESNDDSGPTKTTAPRLDDSTLKSTLTWDDISGSRRLSGPFVVKVEKPLARRSTKVDCRYRITDLDGREFELKIWRTHEISADWEIGSWYVLHEASGSVWETDGTVHKLLNSSRDFRAIKAGP